jgi:hypothetical protein
MEASPQLQRVNYKLWVYSLGGNVYYEFPAIGLDPVQETEDVYFIRTEYEKIIIKKDGLISFRLKAIVNAD